MSFLIWVYTICLHLTVQNSKNILHDLNDKSLQMDISIVTNLTKWCTQSDWPVHPLRTISCMHGHLLSSEHIAKALLFRLVGCPSNFDSSLDAPQSLLLSSIKLSPMQAWSMHPRILDISNRLFDLGN